MINDVVLRQDEDPTSFDVSSRPTTARGIDIVLTPAAPIETRLLLDSGITLTYYIYDAAAPGSSHGSLVTQAPTAGDQFSSPSSLTDTGWEHDNAVAKTQSPMVFGTLRAKASFVSGLNLPGKLGTSDAWRTVNKLPPWAFSKGIWQLAATVTSQFAASKSSLLFRIWQSPNADGSNAIEITNGPVATQQLNNVASGTDSGNDVTPISIACAQAVLDPNGSYIFWQQALRVNIATANPSDVTWNASNPFVDDGHGFGSANIITPPLCQTVTDVVAVILRPNRQFAPIATVGTTTPLTGTATATADQTGQLSATADLVGTSAAVADTSGVLVASADLSGAASAVADSSATLVATVPLNGTAVATGSQTGTLTGAAELIATAVATADQTGTLIASAALTGTSAAVADQTGSLTADVVLTGTAAAIANQAGDLTATGDLVATGVAVGSQSGVLTALAALDGTAAAVAGSVATLTTTSTLTGTASAVAGQSGTLTVVAYLSGVASSGNRYRPDTKRFNKGFC